jgi:uncharacterized membrane protein YecN with MAPEG domain
MKEIIVSFYLAHSFKIMMVGFALSAAGIIVYSQVQHKDPVLRTAGFALTATGIGIYIIGRIGLILQRRQARKQQHQVPDESAIDQKE